MKIIVGLSYFLLLAISLLVLWSVKKYRISIKQNWKTIIIFSVVCLLVMNILLFLYLRQEHFIAYWELGGFWRKTLEFNQLMNENVGSALGMLWESLQNSEYSYLPQFFLSGATQLLGDSFPRFVLAMFNCFIMPFNILLFSFVLMIYDDLKRKSKILIVLLGIIITFFAGNLLPMIHGYVGGAALPFIIIVLILIYCGVLENKISVYSIYIGVILILIVLLRRWYAYTVVGFFSGFGISYLVRWIKEKQDVKKDVLPVFLNLFICGIIPLLLLIVGFNSFFKTMVSYDYAFAYQAMSLYTPLENFVWFIEFYGVLYFGLLLVGVYASIKKKETRYFSLALIILIAVVVIAFNQVQVFGTHHYYMINVFVLYFILYGLGVAFEFIKIQVLEKVILVFISLIMMINASYLFFKEKENRILQFNERLIASPFPYMRQRDDISTIQEMTNFLKYSVGDSSVYVLASSIYFSEDILKNSLLPDELDPIVNLASSHVWDTRDGLPKHFFQYQYIVIADPIQYQFVPEEHRVIGIFAEEIMYDGLLSEYYDEIKTYNIISDIKVKIYKRNVEIPQKVQDEISDIFKSYYPDYPFLYEFE